MNSQIKKFEDKKLSEIYEKTINELGSFFEFKTEYRPNLVIVPDRKTIDSLRKEKTEPWVVGWANNNDVYILDHKNYENESNHKYSEEEYEALIKHELAHCFSRRITDSPQRPTWLSEGISIYLSGQNLLKSKPKKLSKFIDHYDTISKDVYYEAGFAVEFLVNTYGKEKLLELLKESKKAKSKEDFASLFSSIYKIELKYDNFKV